MFVVKTAKYQHILYFRDCYKYTLCLPGGTLKFRNCPALYSYLFRYNPHLFGIGKEFQRYSDGAVSLMYSLANAVWVVVVALIQALHKLLLLAEVALVQLVFCNLNVVKN